MNIFHIYLIDEKNQKVHRRHACKTIPHYIMNLKKRLVLVFMSKNRLLFFVQDLLNFSGSYRDLDSERTAYAYIKSFNMLG